jgi:hypothetical protein
MVRTLSIVTGVASTLLVACREDVASNVEEVPPPVIVASVEPPRTPPPAPAAPPAPVVEAPMRKIDPATLNLSPGVAEVVKLVQSGLDEAVIVAFVQNSTNVFNPSSDELIYLNDMGISGKVMSAMLDRSKQAKLATATNVPPAKVVAENVPAAPLPVTPAPEAPAPPVVVAPAPAPTTTTVVVLPPNAPQEIVHFYEPLSPYGTWMEVAGHGWCWQPTVAVSSRQWRPYADRGRWMYTDAGWYWQSDYSWGWAPFHYGRWMDHSRHGWVWCPDTVWAGAWVAWRSSDTYCGWAPLPPSARYDGHHGFRYNGIRVGVDCDFGLGSSHFTFISKFRFLDRNPNHFYLPHTQVNTVYHNTTIINNYTFDNQRNVNNGGLSSRHLAELTRSEVRKVSVRPADDATPGRPDRLTREGSDYVIYRPRLDKPALASAKPAATAPITKDTTVGTFREKSSPRITLADADPVRTAPAPQTTSDGTRYNPQVPHWMQPGVKTPPMWPGNSTDTTSGSRPDERTASIPDPKTSIEQGRTTGKSTTRRNTGAFNTHGNLTPPQPVTSTPEPLTPPRPITSTPSLLAPSQPITSTPQPLTPPRPITSTPQPLTPPRPITSTPQPLSPPWPVTSTPQRMTPPQPITSVPQPLTPPRPITSTPIRSTPATPTTDRPTYSTPQANATYARPTFTSPAQERPAYNPPSRPAPQPTYTAPAAPVSRPAPAPQPAPSYSQPPRPAPAATPPPATRQETPSFRPQSSPGQQSGDGRRSEGGRDGRRP